MRKFISLICGLMIIASSVAQNNEKSTDDIGRIALTPIVVDESAVPSYAQKVLSGKLKDVVTRNGLGSTTSSPRFVITASVNLLNKEITPTAPPMTCVELATTFYIGDAISGELFSTYTFNSVKAVGTNDQRAYLAAIKQLKTGAHELNAFVEEGKRKIVEYYNSQIDFLLAEAKALSDQEKYDEAMALLATVPNVCKDAYTKAMGQIQVVYQKKIDTESAAYYNQASAAWNANKSKEGASAAVELLAKIHPLSSSASSGNALVKQIAAHYAEIEAYRRQIEERNWNYKVMVEGEERQMKRDQMALDHELEMRKSDNSVLSGQMALEEVKRTTELFVKGKSSSSASTFADNVANKIASWFK